MKEDGLTVTSWRTGIPEPGVLYDRSYLTEKDKYSSFLGGNQPLCVIRNENARDGGKTPADPGLLLRLPGALPGPELRGGPPAGPAVLPDVSVAQYAAENGIDEICVVYSVPNFITDRNLVFLAQ